MHCFNPSVGCSEDIFGLCPSEIVRLVGHYLCYKLTEIFVLFLDGSLLCLCNESNINPFDPEIVYDLTTEGKECKALLHTLRSNT